MTKAILEDNNKLTIMTKDLEDLPEEDKQVIKSFEKGFNDLKEGKCEVYSDK